MESSNITSRAIRASSGVFSFVGAQTAERCRARRDMFTHEESPLAGRVWSYSILTAYHKLFEIWRFPPPLPSPVGITRNFRAFLPFVFWHHYCHEGAFQQCMRWHFWWWPDAPAASQPHHLSAVAPPRRLPLVSLPSRREQRTLVVRVQGAAMYFLTGRLDRRSKNIHTLAGEGDAERPACRGANDDYANEDF